MGFSLNERFQFNQGVSESQINYQRNLAVRSQRASYCTSVLHVLYKSAVEADHLYT